MDPEVAALLEAFFADGKIPDDLWGALTIDQKFELLRLIREVQDARPPFPAPWPSPHLPIPFQTPTPLPWPAPVTPGTRPITPSRGGWAPPGGPAGPEGLPLPVPGPGSEFIPPGPRGPVGPEGEGQGWAPAPFLEEKLWAPASPIVFGSGLAGVVTPPL